MAQADDANSFRRLNALLRELRFSECDHARMAELARKNNGGDITCDKRRELQDYVLMGDILSTLKAKAQQWMDKHKPAS
jgi:hypothetical protein